MEGRRVSWLCRCMMYCTIWWRWWINERYHFAPAYVPTFAWRMTFFRSSEDASEGEGDPHMSLGMCTFFQRGRDLISLLASLFICIFLEGIWCVFKDWGTGSCRSREGSDDTWLVSLPYPESKWILEYYEFFEYMSSLSYSVYTYGKVRRREIARGSRSRALFPLREREKIRYEREDSGCDMQQRRIRCASEN